MEANIKKLEANLAVAKEAHDQLVRSAKAALDKARLDLKTAEVRSAIEAEKLKLAVEEADAHYKQLLAEVSLVEASQRSQLRSSRLGRDKAKIELQRASNNVDRMVMKAPIDGVVVMQSIFRGGDFGQIQQGDQIYPGMSFMQIVDPSSMVISGSVNQVDAEAIRLGMQATTRFDAYPGMELPAHVIGIGAMTKPGTWRPTYMRELPVRLKLDRMDPRVIPDLSASADVLLATEKQATVAPLEAVFQNEAEKPFVLLQGPAGWQRKEVELGLKNHIAVAILSGLRKGDVLAAERPVTPEEN
jgi:multidrug efflux pump subunit AcrA (membrane-fusion protein)